MRVRFCQIYSTIYTFTGIIKNPHFLVIHSFFLLQLYCYTIVSVVKIIKEVTGKTVEKDRITELENILILDEIHGDYQVGMRRNNDGDRPWIWEEVAHTTVL